MKISDYVMQFIAGLGVKKVFFVSGGGAMHLNNSLGENEELEGVCMLHEQGASIAAESYARISEGYGVCLVTSGPGGTNAVTGVAGAYIDSIPVIYISGQVKRADLAGSQGIRQFGIQEVDIISIVTPVTKYAVQIKNPEDIRYEMEKAAAIAVNGRPGPVWVDIPLDIQATGLEIDALRSFDASELPSYPCKKEDVDRTIEAFRVAKKPVLLLGNGIRLSGAVKEARELYEFLGVPCLTTWNGVDLIEDAHPLYFGRPGAVGQRHANFIQQNADFVLTLGTRLNLLSTGYNYESFLGKAFHVMVDIDAKEMEKKSVHPQLKVNCDVKEFISALLARREELINGADSAEKSATLEDAAATSGTKNAAKQSVAAARKEWMAHCNKLKEKYPVRIPEQEPREGFVSTYDLVEEITERMTENDIYQFTSSGSAVDIAMKVFRIKKGQRAFLTKGLASMGYDIPASIGSCIASGGRRTVCITGDGSAAMNVQELEVIRRRNLPIKLFIVDNNGYAMIYGSQNGNFKGHLTGCTEDSGLSLPDLKKVAESFGIKGYHIETPAELAVTVAECLAYDGPAVCTVRSDITQKILPKQTNYMREDGQMASRPLEDMSPLLERDEYEKALSGEL